MQTWMRYAVADGVPRRSLGVAVVVGSALNLINQGDVLFGDGTVDHGKIVLTYVVPYLVATYGAVSARVAAERRVTQDGRDHP